MKSDRPVKLDAKGQLRMLIGDRWRPVEKRECWWCGDEFLYEMNGRRHLERTPGKYCSRSCGGKDRAKRLASTRLWVKCAICGDKFKLAKGRKKRIATCTRQYCRRKYRGQITSEMWAKKRKEKLDNIER